MKTTLTLSTRRCEYTTPSLFLRIFYHRLVLPESWTLIVDGDGDGEGEMYNSTINSTPCNVQGTVRDGNIDLFITSHSDDLHSFSLKGQIQGHVFTGIAFNTFYIGSYNVECNVERSVCSFDYTVPLILNEDYADALSHIYKYCKEVNVLRLVSKAFRAADTTSVLRLRVTIKGGVRDTNGVYVNVSELIHSIDSRLNVQRDGKINHYCSIRRYDGGMYRVTGVYTRDKLVVAFSNHHNLYECSFDLVNHSFARGKVDCNGKVYAHFQGRIEFLRGYRPIPSTTYDFRFVRLLDQEKLKYVPVRFRLTFTVDDKNNKLYNSALFDGKITTCSGTRDGGDNFRILIEDKWNIDVSNYTATITRDNETRKYSVINECPT